MENSDVFLKEWKILCFLKNSWGDLKANKYNTKELFLLCVFFSRLQDPFSLKEKERTKPSPPFKAWVSLMDREFNSIFLCIPSVFMSIYVYVGVCFFSWFKEKKKQLKKMKLLPSARFPSANVKIQFPVFCMFMIYVLCFMFYAAILLST